MELLKNVANVKQDDMGKVDGGVHNFNNRNIIPNFYIGGIVGTNNTAMQIHNTLNTADVTGVSSLNNATNYTGNVLSYTGGIIGEIHNTTANGSSLKYLTNEGKITAGTVPGKVGSESKNFAGGIFGSIKGYGFKSADGTELRNGRFENAGIISGGYINLETYLYLAGIGVANTDQVNSEVSYVINSEGFDIDGLDYKTYNKYIYYAATVIDNTTNGLTLSRAYNTENYTFDDTFFVSDKTEITDSNNLITPDYSEQYNFSFSGYSTNPSNHNPESKNGRLYGNVSKQNNVGYRFIASNSPQRYLEISDLNLRGNFTIYFDVLRNDDINDIDFNLELVGSNLPIYEYEGIANGVHPIDITNLSSSNAVHTIRLTKISGNGTLDLKSIRIEQNTPVHSIEIAPFFTSIHNAPSVLKYVEKHRDINDWSSN